MLKKYFRYRLLTFGFEIKIIDKCCVVVNSRGSGVDLLLLHSTRTPEPFCYRAAIVFILRLFHTYFICSACALHTGCRSITDSLCFHTGRICSLLLKSTANRVCVKQLLCVAYLILSDGNSIIIYKSEFFAD